MFTAIRLALEAQGRVARCGSDSGFTGGEGGFRQFLETLESPPGLDHLVRCDDREAGAKSLSGIARGGRFAGRPRRARTRRSITLCGQDLRRSSHCVHTLPCKRAKGGAKKLWKTGISILGLVSYGARGIPVIATSRDPSQRDEKTSGSP